MKRSMTTRSWTSFATLPTNWRLMKRALPGPRTRTMAHSDSVVCAVEKCEQKPQFWEQNGNYEFLRRLQALPDRPGPCKSAFISKRKLDTRNPLANQID